MCFQYTSFINMYVSQGYSPVSSLPFLSQRPSQRPGGFDLSQVWPISSVSPGSRGPGGRGPAQVAEPGLLRWVWIALGKVAGSQGLSDGLCARKGGHGWRDKGVSWGFWVRRRQVWAWKGPRSGWCGARGT